MKDINKVAQSMPTKIGISDNNFKVIIKNSNNHYSVIQKTNKDYLCYDLKSGSEFGGNGESDYGENHELLRLLRVKPCPACYVYNDDYEIVGNASDYALESQYNTIEEALFKFYAPVAINEYKSNKNNGAGLRCKGVKSADGSGKFTFTFNETKVEKGNILVLATPNSSENNEIRINGKVVKTFDASCLEGYEYRIIEFDLPIKYGNSTILVDVCNKNTSNKNLYLICANFKELKDYKGEYITKYKAFVDSHSYIDDKGANDYAMYDNASGRYCGSYHGGEKLILGKLTWVNSNRFDIESRKIETTIANSYANGSFCIIKDFYVEQRTQIGELGQMISRFDFTVDGTIGMKMSWNGEIETDYFYTSLTCTNTNFKKVLYPQYIELNDEENQDYFIQATQGLITQYNDSGMLKMDIRFDKFDGDYIGKDLWIKSYAGKYRKPYYGLLGKTNIVKNITFNKCLDFYRV